MIKDHIEKHNLNKDKLYLIWTPGFSEQLKALTEQAVKSEGFKEVIWMKTGCVITSHGGKGAFGVVGFSE